MVGFHYGVAPVMTILSLNFVLYLFRLTSPMVVRVVTQQLPTHGFLLMEYQMTHALTT